MKLESRFDAARAAGNAAQRARRSGSVAIVSDRSWVRSATDWRLEAYMAAVFPLTSTINTTSVTTTAMLLTISAKLAQSDSFCFDSSPPGDATVYLLTVNERPLSATSRHSDRHRDESHERLLSGKRSFTPAWDLLRNTPEISRLRALFTKFKCIVNPLHKLG